MTDKTPKTTGATVSRAEAKAERRQQLIAATIDSIARFGLSGTTIARVTEIAGVSIGLANFHFETKELLFEAVLTSLADEQRRLWQNRNTDAALTTAERMVAIVDARFHARICDRKKLAIWFAFYGDASARAIYRRLMSDVDDERLFAIEALFGDIIAEGGYTGVVATDAALTYEALSDGLWLNMLLYPEDFRRLACRAKALNALAAIFPKHFSGSGNTR